MSIHSPVDYIIVGQGLAGSAVAVQLLERGKKILVIDQSTQNTSSIIAAGLFNPVTGRYVKKTWMADTLFRYLHNFYMDVETRTNQSFLHSMPLYSPFTSTEEQNEWMAKSADPQYEDYIESIFTQETISNVKDRFGGLLLKQCGYLDTVTYINAVRQWIRADNLFWDETFAFQELEVHHQYVMYKRVRANKIIFCQGDQALQNKWFNWLPVIPLKGETLTIQTSVHPQQIINRGVYIVPARQGELKVGSTYDFNDPSRTITTKARIELETKLQELVNFPYNVIKQTWGMRPTTPDRRPLIGVHPESEAVAIFNGLGTKGASLSPYFSEVLIRRLENETDLNKEVNVNRYKSLYSKFTK